ncbi:MAG: hypothetical protein LAT75_08245 [Candidatus Cyclonatronum sp.]|uniref:hypothetical protein n=1 Tax=Cyclonatronum sp. TaxID=3024185 RepID=UPI0025BBA5F9|nr:hypothetical protein [Cyclonatronum sp.]MCH8486841.1 hypothetical protein [Cyclonatronum sp.]
MDKRILKKIKKYPWEKWINAFHSGFTVCKQKTEELSIWYNPSLKLLDDKLHEDIQKHTNVEMDDDLIGEFHQYTFLTELFRSIPRPMNAVTEKLFSYDTTGFYGSYTSGEIVKFKNNIYITEDCDGELWSIYSVQLGNKKLTQKAWFEMISHMLFRTDIHGFRVPEIDEGSLQFNKKVKVPKLTEYLQETIKKEKPESTQDVKLWIKPQP